MALRTKLRSIITTRTRFFSTSSILNPDSTTPLSSKEKSRAALSLLRFESNPERVIEICRAASLTPESHLDRVAFSKAISRLKDNNYYEGIRSFISESVARPDLKTERAFSHFIVLYGQAGLVKDAVKLFDEMPQLGIERNVKTLNSLLFSCILAGEYGEMKRVYAEFPKKYGMEPNVETYNTVLRGFCESGSADSAYSILAEMERNRVKPNMSTFATIVEGFYREEKFSDVVKVLDMMKKYDMAAGLSIYNVRIKSLCKLKRSSEAKALFDGILAKGMKPNWIMYNHLIHGFCKEGKLEEAKSLFKMMADNKLKAEAECYFSMVYYLCQGGDIKGALGVCKESMAKGWVPNITTMKNLVEGLISAGKGDEAKELIGQIKEKFQRNADRWSELEEKLPQ